METNIKHRNPPLWLILILFGVVALCQFPLAVLIDYAPRLGMAINEVVILLVLPLVGLRCLGFRPTRLISWRRHSSLQTGTATLLILGTAVALCYLLTLSRTLLPISPAMLRVVETPIAISSSLNYFLTLLLFCLLAPICEEVLFRGLLQTALTQRVGSIRACLFTAVFFALMHGNDWYPHLYFILGFVLSWIYTQTGTIRTPILCHMANNVFVFVLRQFGGRLPLNHTTIWPDTVVVGISGLTIIVTIIILKRQSLHTLEISSSPV